MAFGYLLLVGVGWGGEGGWWGGGGGGPGSSASLAARRARGTELANRIAILPERVENINTLITFLHLRSSLRVKQLVLVDFKYICIYLTFI